MEYEITIERTQRVCCTFHAENDEEASSRASELFGKLTGISIEEVDSPAGIADGDTEWDYAVTDATGRTIVDWE